MVSHRTFGKHQEIGINRWVMKLGKDMSASSQAMLGDS